MSPIHAPAPGGLSNMDPVGGPIAGSSKALRVDQGFQQQGTIPISDLPVVRELPGAQGQDLAGESFDADRGQNQETAIIDDPLQVALALLITPSNPSVARLHLPGWRGP